MIAEHGDSELVEKARTELAELTFDAKQYETVIAEWTASLPAMKDAKLRESGLLRWGETEGLLSQWAASTKAYEMLLTEFPQSKWADRARFGMAWALEKQGQHRRALAEYAKIVAAGKTDELSARSQFQVGECLFALQECDKAVVELRRVGSVYRQEDWRAKVGMCQVGGIHGILAAGRCIWGMTASAGCDVPLARVASDGTLEKLVVNAISHLGPFDAAKLEQMAAYGTARKETWYHWASARNYPFFSGNRVFVRTFDHLYCIGEKDKPCVPSKVFAAR